MAGPFGEPLTICLGNAESNRYNEEVFKNNLKFAILGQLASPPEGFEAATRAHFYLKRVSLVKVRAAMGGAGGHATPARSSRRRWSCTSPRRRRNWWLR
jgi:hypothetical protein